MSKIDNNDFDDVFYTHLKIILIYENKKYPFTDSHVIGLVYQTHTNWKILRPFDNRFQQVLKMLGDSSSILKVEEV